jgi:hypothetical protein
MKRYTAIFLSCLISISLLTACAGSMPSPAGSAALPAGSLGDQIPASESAVTYTLEQNVRKNSATSDDGVVLATCRYELPHLRAYRADGTEITDADAQTDEEKQALETVSVFNGKFEDWVSGVDFQEIADWARQNYQMRPEDFQNNGIAYTAELDTASWQTEHFISISATYYTYTGGAHPNTVLLAWNFDLDAGAFVEPTVVAEDEQLFQQAVTGEIIRQADEKARAEGMEPKDFYWENYQDIAADWASYAVSFDADGMTVGFSQYEMACYAAGEQVFSLSNEFLKPYLSDYGRQLLCLPAPDSE